jgi:hypothetical protein
MKGKSEKGHDRRKNPKSAEAYKQERQERNALRPSQYWIGGTVAEGGHWERKGYISVVRQAKAEN